MSVKLAFKKFTCSAVIAVFAILGAGVEKTFAADKKMSIGYQKIAAPWISGIADGAFEKSTGYSIDWRVFESGASAMRAFEKGEVQIALAGSSPIAIGASTGANLELFWIVDDINFGEALVVKRGTKTVSPQDLRGMTIGVPFASTSHFHLLFALEQFGIPLNEVRIRDLNPAAIELAWARNEIDAAFVWNPTLGALLKSGQVLIYSGTLTRWGKATFDGLVADRNWAKANPSFMVNFVRSIAAIDAKYRRNPRSWNSSSSQVENIVKLVGGNTLLTPRALRLYKYPNLSEQASRAWLGRGNKSGAAIAL
jgi:taurine transport system substrate-binding protein